jgi:hypothetical protein
MDNGENIKNAVMQRMMKLLASYLSNEKQKHKQENSV